MTRLFCRFLACLVAAGICLSCSLFDLDPSGGIYSKPMTPGGQSFNLLEHTTYIDTVIYLEADPYVMGADAQTKAVRQGVDVHLEVVPMYAFTDNNYAGDYYAVSGYFVAHNGELGVESENIYTHNRAYTSIGPFMGNLGFRCAMLDKDGGEVTSQDVQFQTTPEPSTTIGSTTYLSGFTFTLSTPLTFGTKRKDGSYHTTIFPSILPTFSWTNSSTQNLPDETVEMNTDGETREVIYNIKTNHSKSFNLNGIPVHARSDQKVAFSWIWHVPKGKLSSVEYGQDGVKFRIVLDAGYFINYEYTDYSTDYPYTNEYYSEVHSCSTPLEKRTATFDIKGLNRTPVGTLDFANATKNYVMNVRVFHADSGEEMPINGFYGQYKHLQTSLCCGTYLLYYTLKNADTDAVIGNYVVKDIVITKDAVFETSTLKATKL